MCVSQRKKEERDRDRERESDRDREKRQKKEKKKYLDIYKSEREKYISADRKQEN